jgi:hypothetical protein
MACMIKFSPPTGKLLKSVSVARSNEHMYLLEGGDCNCAGAQLVFPGHYGLNPAGHPHSAFIDRGMIIWPSIQANLNLTTLANST